MNQFNLFQKLMQILFVFMFSVSIFAQEGETTLQKNDATTQDNTAEVAKGKKLFKANCASCHKLDGKLIGPPLRNISDKHTNEWLHLWIKDNNALRKSGDAKAKDIFDEYNGSPMTAFPQLSKEDIDAMLAYFSAKPPKKDSDKDGILDKDDNCPFIANPDQLDANENGVGDVCEEAKEGSSAWMSWIVALALIALLVYMLFVSKNGFLKIMAVIALILTITYLLFNALLGVGVDQDYMPIQPIEFSHKVHAGDNKIDCQYCHSSAKHSKTSGVPTANVCMNCHKSIAEVSEDTKLTKSDGTVLGKKELDAEIQKIYDAVGWDPENFKYKENYEEKAIEWVRVHNLPDFAYYNHSQHVTVAGLDCQKCHGPVEEMDEMYQFSPLTMGWCIDCHKDSEVNKDNGYYTKMYEKFEKDHKKVTIADLGGRECAKCHY